MAVKLNPYILMENGAEEALNFYKSVFGGELTLNRFSEFPNPSVSEEHANKIMHGALETEDLQLMVADSAPTGGAKVGENIQISLSGQGEDDAKLSGYYEALCAGGTVLEPLKVAPWGDKFGMLIDKYGIHWMINIAGLKGGLK